MNQIQRTRGKDAKCRKGTSGVEIDNVAPYVCFSRAQINAAVYLHDVSLTYI